MSTTSIVDMSLPVNVAQPILLHFCSNQLHFIQNGSGYDTYWNRDQHINTCHNQHICIWSSSQGYYGYSNNGNGWIYLEELANAPDFLAPMLVEQDLSFAREKESSFQPTGTWAEFWSSDDEFAC